MKNKILDFSHFLYNDSSICIVNKYHESLANSSFFVISVYLARKLAAYSFAQSSCETAGLSCFPSPVSNNGKTSTTRWCEILETSQKQDISLSCLMLGIINTITRSNKTKNLILVHLSRETLQIYFPAQDYITFLEHCTLDLMFIAQIMSFRYLKSDIYFTINGKQVSWFHVYF